jgi:hypothetical protein
MGTAASAVQTSAASRPWWKHNFEHGSGRAQIQGTTPMSRIGAPFFGPATNEPLALEVVS